MFSYNWTHKRWCRPSDPMNIIFRKITLQDVQNHLVNSHGWQAAGPQVLRPVLAPDQFIPDPDPANKRPQSLQLTKPLLGYIIRRYHLRLWSFSDHLIGSVHMDALRQTGHTAADFESVEKYLASICRLNPAWKVTADAEDMDNRISDYGKPYNNGRATVVEPL